MIDELLCILVHVSITQLPHYQYWAFCTLCALKGKSETSFFNWFEVLKLLSVLIGNIMMDLEYDCSLIFRLNILEAVFAGRRDPLNALLGIYLVFGPLNFLHACLYSIWNARFSYKGGFSRSTRIILLVPFIGPWSHDRWLKIRGRSLLLNMALRASQWMSLYIPGETSVTQKNMLLSGGKSDPSTVHEAKKPLSQTLKNIFQKTPNSLM